MPHETEPTYFSEQDVEFDTIALHRLRSEGTTSDLLQAYRGMVQKYAERQPEFARALQVKTTEIWPKLTADQKAELEEINATIVE